jgi:hypothetical protein
VSLPSWNSGAIETAQWALGEQILVVNGRLHKARDTNDLEAYLRDKTVMDALERAREALR